MNDNPIEKNAKNWLKNTKKKVNIIIGLNFLKEIWNKQEKSLQNQWILHQKLH